jgi:hypothetical protein
MANETKQNKTTQQQQIQSHCEEKNFWPHFKPNSLIFPNYTISRKTLWGGIL